MPDIFPRTADLATLTAARTDTVDRLLASLGEALHAHLDPQRGLLDPIRQGPTPPDHYGNCAAALALYALDADAWPRARPALQAWMATRDAHLGHLPFNRLLLLLLAGLLDERGADAMLIAEVHRAIQRCRLSKSYPSNNWALLAQTCRLLEAPADRKQCECTRLCAMLERWTTRAGGFIDFPAHASEHIATPLAYHHKALFLAALACRFHNDAALSAHTQRLLIWAAQCWNPAGYAGGLGRSNHALFGDACLLAAMLLLDVGESSAGAVDALAGRLAAQQRPDGLLWLTPSGMQSGTASWDSYMHLSVYNAWAAAIIATARILAPRPPTTTRFAWPPTAPGYFHDPEAGIVSWRAPGGSHALIATRGQPPQSFSRHEADLRYAGGTILHLAGADGVPLAPPPTRLKRSALQAQPALAGWTPLVDVGGEVHALSDFDDVTVTPHAHGIRIDLEGSPRPVFRAPARTLLERAISAIDWRILGGRLGRHASLKRKAAAGLRGKLSLHISEANTPRVDATVGFTVSPGRVACYLNPAGHALIGAPPTVRGIRCAPSDASLTGAHACAAAPYTMQPGLQAWSFTLSFEPDHRARFEITSTPAAPARGHPGVPTCSQ